MIFNFWYLMLKRQFKNSIFRNFVSYDFKYCDNSVNFAQIKRKHINIYFILFYSENTCLGTFPWFIRVPQSTFEANRSRGSWVMFGQTNIQTNRDYNFIYRCINRLPINGEGVGFVKRYNLLPPPYYWNLNS